MITKEQLSELPEELVLKAVNECVLQAGGKELYSNALHIGLEIKEKLNAKKKVDYSVMVKYAIDCVGACGVFFTPKGTENFTLRVRTNHWFSALNFDDVEQVIEDLKQAGFDVDKDCDEWNNVIHAFKINGAAEGYEF